ncbi:hypothetical protein [Neorhizobium alkalisoli]|uniref:hypothetical protein n=1 Tax=Neorhizobium alkalisoli TaxID=528178 RepID=UPI001319E931|nr:hypothetical protein [Neorhizobium alkalisoli]
MVAKIAKAARDQGIAAAPETEAILELAVRASFKPDAMSDGILDAVAETGGATVDPAVFAKAVAAFEEGRAKVARMYEAQDQAAAKDIETRLADTGTGPRITQLADLMASPDLAVETAFTGQVMYVALEAFENSSAAELASAPQDKLQAEMKGVMEQLRARIENEKPVPKDVARTDEKSRLAFILATLPSEDLSVLSDFYASAAGKAKRQALVDAYKQASDQANTKMLGVYFAELADYLKANPRAQQ